MRARIEKLEKYNVGFTDTQIKVFKRLLLVILIRCCMYHLMTLKSIKIELYAETFKNAEVYHGKKIRIH